MTTRPDRQAVRLAGGTGGAASWLDSLFLCRASRCPAPDEGPGAAWRGLRKLWPPLCSFRPRSASPACCAASTTWWAMVIPLGAAGGCRSDGPALGGVALVVMPAALSAKVVANQTEPAQPTPPDAPRVTGPGGRSAPPISALTVRLARPWRLSRRPTACSSPPLLAPARRALPPGHRTCPAACFRRGWDASPRKHPPVQPPRIQGTSIRAQIALFH